MNTETLHNQIVARPETQAKSPGRELVDDVGFSGNHVGMSRICLQDGSPEPNTVSLERESGEQRHRILRPSVGEPRRAETEGFRCLGRAQCGVDSAHPVDDNTDS